MCTVKFAILLAITSFFRNAVAEDNEAADCLENCLSELQQRAPRLDAASVLSLGHIKSGNQTVMCPKYDAQLMNSTCGPYRDASVCLAKCPDSQLKTLSTSGFAPLQLVCVDRKNDFERYMPCLSENCPSVEATCQPKCGSFDDLSKDVLQLLRQVRGSASGDQAVNVHIDPTNVTMIIAKACDAIECYADCSRTPTTSKCGDGAYSLEIDTIWTIFTAMTQSMSSIGLSTPWPDSCKTLSSRSNTWSKAATATPDQNATRSNSVDQFIQKEQNRDAAGNLTTSTQKCEGGACGMAPEKMVSIFTLFTCFALAMIFQ